MNSKTEACLGPGPEALCQEILPVGPGKKKGRCVNPLPARTPWTEQVGLESGASQTLSLSNDRCFKSFPRLVPQERVESS